MKNKLIKILMVLILSIGVVGCYYSTKDYSTKSKPKSKPKTRIFFDIKGGMKGYCDSVRTFENGITIYDRELPNDSVTLINAPVQLSYRDEE